MNKKGLTLIELLAVIVILAVIALIVTPAISGIIDMAKKSANLRSAEGYVEAIKTKLISTTLSNEKVNDGLYTVEQMKNMNVLFSGTSPDDGDIAILNGAVVSADLIFNGNKVNVNSFGVATSKSKIYGLKWDGTNYTRLESALGLNSCVGTNEQVCTSDFDKEEIYNEIHDVVLDGNSFVYIPKFYIKKVVNDNIWEWYISRVKQDDSYYLPECFHDLESDRELPYILVGKYDSSLDDTGTKLSSRTNVIPLVNKNIIDFRKYALANNNDNITGYQLYDIYTLDAIETLFYIEFSTLNSQDIMKGYSEGQSIWNNNHKVVNADSNNITITTGVGSLYKVGQLIDIATASAGRDVATNLLITAIDNDTITFEDTKWTEHKNNISAGNVIYNVSAINGQTNNIKAKSGSIDNTSGEYLMKYRGIENLYGNILQFIDGVNINNDTNEIFVNKNPKTYLLDTDDYKTIGYSKYNEEGWVTKLGFDSNNPFINLPIAVGGNESVKYGDRYWQNTTSGKRVVAFGGNWSDSTGDGISSFSLNNSQYDCRYFIGARLIKKAL